MATIAGQLLKPDGTVAPGVPIRVELLGAPWDGAGVARASVPLLFWTDSIDGDYSFTLAEGGYRVFLPAAEAFDITVPSGADTYTLDEVAGGYVIPTRGDYPSFATVADAQAAVILGTRVDILSNGRGRPASFVYDATYTGDDDGIAGFYDSTDKPFKAFIRE